MTGFSEWPSRRRWFGALLLLGMVSCRKGSEPVVSSDDGSRPPPSTSTPLAQASTTPAELRASPREQPATSQRPWPPAPPAVTSDFCIEGVQALDEETCYVLPAAPTSELLLYLHGIVPPERTSRQKTNFETVVQNASRRAGVAALMPRGELGLAPKGHQDWWGWPTTAAAHRKWSPKLLAKLAEKRRKLEQLVGRPFTRLYVAGSSSGAYYAIELALSGDLVADGFAALSGATSATSATSTRADLSGLARKPFYIGYGSFDTVGGAARALAETLERSGWPVRLAEHGVPHGTAEIYLDEAFAFWRTHLTDGAK